MRPETLPPVSSFENRPHGTRLRYLSGCKCVPCRAANSRYETERAAARKRGEGGHIIGAGRARRHIRTLGRNGIGYKTVSDASGVASSIVFSILSGRRKRIRASTERRILSVDHFARADHSLVSANRTSRLIGSLLLEGYTKTFLARALGSKAKTPALQLKGDFVTAKNAAKVERLYRRLTE